MQCERNLYISSCSFHYVDIIDIGQYFGGLGEDVPLAFASKSWNTFSEDKSERMQNRISLCLSPLLKGERSQG